MSEAAAGRMGPGGKGGAAAAGCLLAIDFGGTKIAMATATPSGERLGEAEIPTLAAEGAARVLARTREAGLALLARTRREQRGAGDAGALPLLAVAAVTPGIVQPDGIRFAPNNPGWETLALEPALRRMFEVRVVGVATDVKAAAPGRCAAARADRRNHRLAASDRTGAGDPGGLRPDLRLAADRPAPRQYRLDGPRAAVAGTARPRRRTRAGRDAGPRRIDLCLVLFAAARAAAGLSAARPAAGAT
ncbi:hypothetical protein [Burkholderia gladioli]|uniref:hypothetical protein n=1 Tax=Burkholderia gladioli TaxID=28095 RepID=UPI003C79E1B0